MEWSKPILKIRPDVAQYDNIYCKFTSGRFPCSYCGGKFRRNMRQVIIGTKKYTCCDMCYYITHINYGARGNLCVCYSKMSQYDIIKKTIDYIKENDIIPFFNEIDKDVKIVPISIIEYSNILMSKKKLPKQMDNYKIFITQNYDTTFIDTCAYMFYNDKQDDKNEYKCNIYTLTNNENKFIHNLFR